MLFGAHGTLFGFFSYLMMEVAEGASGEENGAGGKQGSGVTTSQWLTLPVSPLTPAAVMDAQVPCLLF